MSGVQMVIAAGAPSPYRGFTGGTTSDVAISPATSTASTQLETSGAVTHGTSDIPGPFLNWYLPNTTGIGSGHWVRATVTSGTLTSGTTGTWLQLNAARAWTKQQAAVGSSSVTFTLELATDSGGANIVATCSVTLTAEVTI